MMLSSRRFTKKRISLLLAYSLSALLMIWLSYLLPSLLPGDFVTAMYSTSEDVTLTAAQESELRAYYSQDTGFSEYLLKLIRLDWGNSYAFLTPVSELFFEALPWTLLLLVSANILAALTGFIAGVEAAFRRNSRFERSLVSCGTVLEGLPEICTGVILLAVFSLYLGWFPAAGAETAYAELSFQAWLLDVGHHLTLPLASLVIAYFPGNFLLTRTSMIMVISQPYIKTAQAKGLSGLRIRYAHAARNALLPLVTRFGLRLAFTVTGAFVVERIHAYPGLGTLLFNAIRLRDLPVIQAIVLISSIMVLAMIMVLELVYAYLDPRVQDAYQR
ncbi:peptide/nickel transport system permease protein [Candidatus Electrothrix aarhusensis]|jgi:peptide/nickel transport system permease protein|uniref:Peptide/nickel transport system permease protein n=1 Tax=Candidatus Electrothrix aarhusensis TaxID=1859131 RepID=A0A444IUX6_9BACT|nr:peptide/nickel transport system permease protein [Candidatus Electrothrix aarhusensis]